MTPKEVRDMACQASTQADLEMALRACHAIKEMDLFLGRRTPPVGQFQIVTTHRDKPCQGCGDNIPRGSSVHWLPGKGCWHYACDPQTA